MKSPNTGGYLLQNWLINCNDKHNNGKIQNFVKSMTTNFSTVDSGARDLPPIGDSSMYMETSPDNHGNNVFVSFERTDLIQTTNIFFYCNRFAILTKDLLKSMARYTIKLLVEDFTRSMRCNKPKHDQYSDTSTEWTLVSLLFTEENFGIKITYDQIDTPYADLRIGNITISHSVF